MAQLCSEIATYMIARLILWYYKTTSIAKGNWNKSFKGHHTSFSSTDIIFSQMTLSICIEHVQLDTRIIKCFQTFFVWALLLIVHTWNSSPPRSNILRLQSTCCTVPTTSGRPHGSPLVWAYQWPSSQPLSSPQLSHNNSLWD